MSVWLLGSQQVYIQNDLENKLMQEMFRLNDGKSDGERVSLSRLINVRLKHSYSVLKVVNV